MTRPSGTADGTRDPLTVAAAQPTCRPGEITENVRAHAALVRRAASRVVVFPELSLTGYDLAALAVGPATTTVAYRKTWLGGDEADHFARGDGPTVLTVDGWRLGLGICKDTGSAQHTAGTAALDVDAYVAGVAHRPDELPEQEARATVIARTCRAYVVLASAAGAVGELYPETCGVSAVWAPHGLAVTRAGPDPDDLARATLV